MLLSGAVAQEAPVRTASSQQPLLWGPRSCFVTLRPTAFARNLNSASYLLESSWTCPIFPKIFKFLLSVFYPHYSVKQRWNGTGEVERQQDGQNLRIRKQKCHMAKWTPSRRQACRSTCWQTGAHQDTVLACHRAPAMMIMTKPLKV